MAKTSQANKQPDDDFFGDVPLPEEGRKVVGDCDAYWDFDKSAIRFKPNCVKLFDSKQATRDQPRVSALILGETTVPTVLYTQDDEETEEGPDGTERKKRMYDKYPAGTIVGIFYKPGMKGIIKRTGVDCYLKKGGTKKTGKPNPMQLFEIVADRETHLIPIAEDLRDRSRDLNTPFDPPSVRASKGRKVEDDNDDDEDDDNPPF